MSSILTKHLIMANLVAFDLIAIFLTNSELMQMICLLDLTVSDLFYIFS